MSDFHQVREPSHPHAADIEFAAKLKDRILAAAGLLAGRRATTHWRSLPWMRESFPGVTVEEQLHVVEDGNVLTSAGISAGIDMALRVVVRYFGDSVGRATARHMEYPFPDDNRRRVPMELVAQARA